MDYLTHTPPAWSAVFAPFVYPAVALFVGWVIGLASYRDPPPEPPFDPERDLGPVEKALIAKWATRRN